MAAYPSSLPALADSHVPASEALLSFGYAFDDEQRLVHTKTGKPFEFVNQAHYERLADVVADYIQEVMVQKYDMQRVELEDYMGIRPRVPIFVSKSTQKSDTVLILLCGSGKVAAGQWARRLCINDSLKSGSVLPFLEWAAKHDIGVVVLNPNFLSHQYSRGRQNVSLEHVLSSWDRVIQPLSARHFIMVAHSFGGVGACYLLYERATEILERMCAIALTDSIHSNYETQELLPSVKQFFCEKCINWVTSSTPLNSLLSTAIGCPVKKEDNSPSSRSNGTEEEQEVGNGAPKIRLSTNEKTEESEDNMATDSVMCDCPRISAGTDAHDLTTSSAFQPICKFLLHELEIAKAKHISHTGEESK